MKIFFTCSKSGLGKYEQAYWKVLDEIKKKGTKVEATLGKSYLDHQPALKKVLGLGLDDGMYKFIHDSSVRAAIQRCDATIIEATYASFRLGFEAFFALSIQKPVLVLSKLRNFGNLINHPNFFGAKYTDFTLPDEIDKFLRHVKKHKLRNRFNLFISDEQKVKLDKVSQMHGISMSDYVRNLIDKDNKTLD